MLTAIIIVAVIAVLLLLPVGFEADYDKNGLRAEICISIIHFAIHRKTGKAEQKKKCLEKIMSLSFKEWLRVVKMLLKALKSFKKHTCIDKLRLVYVCGDADPSTAALRYAAVNYAASAILSQIEQSFSIKSREVIISVDYDAEKSTTELSAALSVRTGYALLIILLVHFSFKAARMRSAFKSYRERKLRRGQQAGRFNA